jgi:hypothetical protein
MFQERSSSGKNQESVNLVLTKQPDAGLVPPKESCRVLCETIAKPNPDDFGWKSEQKTALMKLRVLRDDREAVLLGKF